MTGICRVIGGGSSRVLQPAGRHHRRPWRERVSEMVKTGFALPPRPFVTLLTADTTYLPCLLNCLYCCQLTIVITVESMASPRGHKKASGLASCYDSKRPTTEQDAHITVAM